MGFSSLTPNQSPTGDKERDMSKNWSILKEKLAVFQVANTLETRGPSCFDDDVPAAKDALRWGWVQMEELVEVTGVSAAELLTEFWDVDKKLLRGRFPNLLVFQCIGGEDCPHANWRPTDLHLISWRVNKDSSSEHIQYTASLVKYVPAGWASIVIKGVKKKREEADHLQEVLKWRSPSR